MEPIHGDSQIHTNVDEGVQSSVSLLSGSLAPVTEISEESPGQSTSDQSGKYIHDIISSTLDTTSCNLQLENLSDAGSTTTPQALNAYEVDAQKIDDCFAL
jgi:hypothetical protein